MFNELFDFISRVLDFIAETISEWQNGLITGAIVETMTTLFDEIQRITGASQEELESLDKEAVEAWYMWYGDEGLNHIANTITVFAKPSELPDIENE